MSRVRAVLFGGSGFVGSHLARRLIAAGASVLIADIREPTFALTGVDYRYCDVRKPIELGMSNADTVYNLAAVHRTPGHQDWEYYETNVRGALHVTDWVAAAGILQLCFVSSISVYGSGGVVVDESSPTSPNHAYGRSKLLAEEIHLRFANVGGIKLVILRPAVVFGVGENGNFTRLAKALRKKVFAFPGDSTTIKSCIYIDELLKIADFCLQRTDSVIVANASYPELYSIGDICREFNEVQDSPSPRRIPRFVFAGLEVAGRLNLPTLTPLVARAHKLRSSTAVRPGYLLEHQYAWSTDLRSAIRDWSATSGGRFE